MRLVSLYTFILTGSLLVVGCANCKPGPEERRARARLVDTQGNEVGEAQLVERPNGIELQVEAQGLPPGAHGFHIHEVGECVGDFTSAGDHLNPYGAQHGLEDPDGAHLGDLPNLIVGDDGRANAVYLVERATLESSGVDSLIAGDGTALIIHANPDDQVTDPSGNSGGRLVCGVIELI